jgi:hypothetical protein
MSRIWHRKRVLQPRLPMMTIFQEEGTMPTESCIDRYSNFKFLIEIDGEIVAGFQECSGLEVDTDVIDYREGSDPNRECFWLKTDVSFTLNRGLVGSVKLWNGGSL